jgi:hypothetical protein
MMMRKGPGALEMRLQRESFDLLEHGSRKNSFLVTDSENRKSKLRRAMSPPIGISQFSPEKKAMFRSENFNSFQKFDDSLDLKHDMADAGPIHKGFIETQQSQDVPDYGNDQDQSDSEDSVKYGETSMSENPYREMTGNHHAKKLDHIQSKQLKMKNSVHDLSSEEDGKVELNH